MNAVTLLFLIGIALLAADVFASSFILAVIGFVAMAGGTVAAYNTFGVMGASIAGLTAVGLLALTIYLELFWLPKTKFGRGLVVNSVVDATSQPPVADSSSVVGKAAEALTTLAPSGYVNVEGKRYEAFSQSGLVPKGATLLVVAVDNFRLIVSKS